MKVGIVLGAGGPLGWVYHLGVIEGLREAIGCKFVDADRIVATSAGAPIAASLLSGASSEEVLERIIEPPSNEMRGEMRANGSDQLRKPLRLLRPLAPNLIPKVRQVGLSTAAVGLLPAGIFPTSPLLKIVAEPNGQWPRPLWVPSVRIDDGQVVVFGRDSTEVSVGEAIEATSAVPGLFKPKLINGSRYVDGAVASATHADTLVKENIDVALISSPMTRPGRGPIRVRSRRQLKSEVAALQSTGTKVVVLSPTSAIAELAQGFPRRHKHAGSKIVALAREETARALVSTSPE